MELVLVKILPAYSFAVPAR